MKTMIVLSMLMVAACAAPAGSMRSTSESYTGSWRGELVRGQVRTPAEVRLSEREGSVQGEFWGHALMPVALTGLQLGRNVHFEVPEMGTFDGTAAGDVIAGTFHDGAGEGSFTLEKHIDWDDPRNAP